MPLVAAHQTDPQSIARQSARHEHHLIFQSADSLALVGEVVNADLSEFPCPGHGPDRLPRTLTLSLAKGRYTLALACGSALRCR